MDELAKIFKDCTTIDLNKMGFTVNYMDSESANAAYNRLCEALYRISENPEYSDTLRIGEKN